MANQITLQVTEIDKIIAAMVDNNFMGASIKIIEKGLEVIIRDSNDMHITSWKRQTDEEMDG